MHKLPTIIAVLWHFFPMNHYYIQEHLQWTGQMSSQLCFCSFSKVLVHYTSVVVVKSNKAVETIGKSEFPNSSRELSSMHVNELDLLYILPIHTLYIHNITCETKHCPVLPFSYCKCFYFKRIPLIYWEMCKSKGRVIDNTSGWSFQSHCYVFKPK